MRHPQRCNKPGRGSGRACYTPLLQSASDCLETRGRRGGGAGSRRGPKTLENKQDPAKPDVTAGAGEGLAGSGNVSGVELVTGVTSAVTRARELVEAARKAVVARRYDDALAVLDALHALLKSEQEGAA